MTVVYGSRTHLKSGCIKNGAVKTYDLTKFNDGGVYKVAYENRQGGIWLGYCGEINGNNTAKLLRIQEDRVERFDFPATPSGILKRMCPVTSG